MEKINVALIGHGYWGSKLEKYIKENKNFNLRRICNSKSNLEEIWNDKKITSIIEATCNESRYSVVKSALIGGKNVLTEKPLALKSKQCEELRKIAQDNNLELMVDYTHTFSLALNKAEKIVRKGEIGAIKCVELAIKHLGRFGGGNAYQLLGSHMLSILDMFIPIRDLYFEKRDLVKYRGQVETGIISFKNKNISGQIFVSLNYPGKYTNVTIYGNRGSIIYNPLSQPSLHIEKYKREKWIVGAKLPKKIANYYYDESNNLRYTLEHFLDVLNEKGKSNVERAVQITKVLEKFENN